ncbi:MAG: glycosyltransferase, partial [Isosphaeraceae bacterium]
MNEIAASIIIPCFNQLEFTRHCFRALFRHTRPAFELIVVDNGSTDGTGAYLAGVQDASGRPVTVISNARNMGFPAAVNQGLHVARGQYLVLLNNDAVVTDGWLDQLIALAEMKTESTTESTEDTERERRAGGTTNQTNLTNGNGGDGRETRIGLVGPMSNYATPPQLVQQVPYKGLEEMQAFAVRWRDDHRGQWFTAGKLSGFCLLVKRSVYQTIGGLDERFGLGLFDDDDLAVRARKAGFELAVAHDLFIHHFGSRSFVGNGIDAERLLQENGRKFAEKWGMANGRWRMADGKGQMADGYGRAVRLRPWGGQPRMGTGEGEPRINADGHGWGSETQREACQTRGGGPHPGSGPHSGPYGSSTCKAKVSLTMIVRDEENNIGKCLSSVAGLFDEIVVVDTGSKDGTREIAREFGARVFEFVWVDDFAAARNAALARATGDYAFWLDADDVVDPPEREKLQALLESLRTAGAVAPDGGLDVCPNASRSKSRSTIENAAYVVRCACDPGPNGDGGQTVVDHIRLFPLREDVRWTYRVHEQILPALRRANVPVKWTDVTVRHTGYTDPDLRVRKLRRDWKILEEELAERPNDPFVLFNLGSIAVEGHDWPTALDYLRRSLSGSAPTDSIARKLFALIARCHQMLGDLPGALAVCAEGLSFDPDDAELLFRKAVAHRHAGQPAEAETTWRRILTLKRPEQFCSVDQGIYGHLTLRNLAAL